MFMTEAPTLSSATTRPGSIAVVRPRSAFWSANTSTSTIAGVLPAWLMAEV